MKSPADPRRPLQTPPPPSHSTSPKSGPFQSLGLLVLLDQVLLFTADGGQAATKRQHSGCWSHPLLPITQTIETDEIFAPSPLVPLCGSVLPLSLKATKSNRQSACPSEELRGQALSCYPFDLIYKSGRVGGKLHEGKSREASLVRNGGDRPATPRHATALLFCLESGRTSLFFRLTCRVGQTSLL